MDSVDGVPVAFCKYIVLNRNNFHPSKQLHVQLTVSWNARHNTNKTNDATAVWSEEVTKDGFKGCVMVAGRHYFGGFVTKPSIHWLVYQEEFIKGDNTYLEGGILDMKTWYTGGRCVKPVLSVGLFSTGFEIRLFIWRRDF